MGGHPRKTLSSDKRALRREVYLQDELRGVNKVHGAWHKEVGGEGFTRMRIP